MEILLDKNWIGTITDYDDNNRIFENEQTQKKILKKNERVESTQSINVVDDIAYVIEYIQSFSTAGAFLLMFVV